MSAIFLIPLIYSPVGLMLFPYYILLIFLFFFILIIIKEINLMEIKQSIAEVLEVFGLKNTSVKFSK